MSYFYLTPIKGNISLHLLEECVHQRWLYFQKNHNGNPDGFCEYIVENSAYDSTGHFMLNLLSTISKDYNLIASVTRGEESLFFKRISSAKCNEIRILCKSILKDTKTMTKDFADSYVSVLKTLCRNLVIKHIAEHVTTANHNEDCAAHSLTCHFTLCLPLIAARKVEIKAGIAYVPCGEWKHFFRLLFKSHLDWKYTQNKINSSHIDPRWRDIIHKLINNISNRGEFNLKLLKSTDIDEKSNLFPLCMKSIHLTLRNKHRLSHDERFSYTLFLKDIGLPMQQAIHFWQQEYSKPCNGTSSCSHSWSKDGKKYIYGVRHLYGLEGSRKNYKMFNCNRIQSQSSQGGCPFKNYNEEHLKKIIDFSVVTEKQWNTMQNKIHLHKYNDACSLYKNIMLSNKCMERCSPAANSFSPVDYFTHLDS